MYHASTTSSCFNEEKKIFLGYLFIVFNAVTSGVFVYVVNFDSINRF